MPVVSVLMAVADVESHFDAALSSVLSQSLADIEVILMLNGRAVELAAALRERYPDPRLIVATCAIRQLSYALNRAYELATGEFLARMDGDDVCDRERFAEQVALLRARPELGVVGCQVRYVDEHDRPLAFTRRLPAEPAAIRRLQYGEGGVVHPAVMMRRSAFLAVSGYLGGVYSQDLDLWLRMRRAGIAFGNVDRVLFSYRIHLAQESCCKRDAQYAEAFGLFAREAMLSFDVRFGYGMATAAARRVQAAWRYWRRPPAAHGPPVGTVTAPPPTP